MQEIAMPLDRTQWLDDVDIAALGVLTRGTSRPGHHAWQSWIWRVAVGSVEERAAWHLVRARILIWERDGYHFTLDGIHRIEAMLSACAVSLDSDSS